MELALSFQVLVWMAVLGLFLASGQASLYHPATWYLLFHGLVFVLRPMLVQFLGFTSIWNYIGIQPADEEMEKTLVVTSVALVVFVSACAAAGWSSTRFREETALSFSSNQRRALLIATSLFLPLAAYSIFATRNGVAGDRVGGIYIMTNSTGYVNDAQFVIAPLICAWAIVTRFHWANLIPTILYMGYRAWFGWARWTLVLFFLTMIIVYCWHKRRKWLPASTLVLGLPILALFNLLGHNRDIVKSAVVGESMENAEREAGMSSFDKLRMQADTQDFANFDYLTFILAIVPTRTGTFTYGAQYLQLFTEPIPRILWKSKPVGAPVQTFNIGAYGNFIGLTFSLPGDGWASGGWVGVVITLFLAGGLLGFFHRWFWRHVEKPAAAVFYLTALPMFIQWYRDGGISIAKFMLWTWLPLLVWFGIAWLLGPRWVRGASIDLRSGETLRLLKEEHP